MLIDASDLRLVIGDLDCFLYPERSDVRRKLSFLLMPAMSAIP